MREMWSKSRTNVSLTNVNGLNDFVFVCYKTRSLSLVSRLSNQRTKHNFKLNERYYIIRVVGLLLDVVSCAFVMYFWCWSYRHSLNFLVENQMASLSFAWHCLFVCVVCICCRVVFFSFSFLFYFLFATIVSG